MGIVTDHRQTPAARLHGHENGGLQAVGVLILVDQDMVEATADILCQFRVRHHLRPVEKQVIIIENVLRLLGLHVRCKKPLQLSLPSGSPGIGCLEDFVDRRLRVHDTGIDGEACPLGRKTAFGLGEAKLVPDEVHQVGAVLAIVYREVDIQPNLVGIHPQQPRADAMKRSGPGERIGHDRGVVSEHLATDTLDPPPHLGGRAAREGHEQNTARIGTIDDEVRHAVRQSIGLSRPCARNDEKRTADVSVLGANTMHDSVTLPVVQFFQISCHQSPSCICENASRIALTAHPEQIWNISA